MREPFDGILSNKSKTLKRKSDAKSYFDNTNDTLGLYKNPTLKKEEEEEEEKEDKPSSALKGMGLLKKIYGGSNPCWKGYSQFGMKVKNGEEVPNCIPTPIGGCNSCQTNKKVLNKVVDNYTDVIPANKVPKKDTLYKVSNPLEVQKKAFELYGKNGIVYKSNNPQKKYQILNTLTGKWVHFGDAKMEDFTKHNDIQRQSNYLNRALNIKGKWKQNPYSPNILAIMLLW
jgi:hypothetical protein